jgi:S-adenosylmethionine:tRNA ribosyltransferase-isomerase
MKLSDFDYELPSELIARYPLADRSASRLLCLQGKAGHIQHRKFTDLLTLTRPKDLLIFNNTKVITARLLGKKESGGKVEMLVERILDSHTVLAHVRASKSPRPESYIIFNDKIRFKMLRREEDLFVLRCEETCPVLEVIEAIGQIPLPPYFQREPEESDKERYQTIFAEHKGSVAAPTAGLHFDPDMMQALKERGVNVGFVTLHVGAGTFAPVREDEITAHRMHAEYSEVSAELCELIRQTKAQGGRVIAIGTTSARSLETAAKSGDIQAFKGDTDIFIYPGYQFKCVDVLFTNLHLPGSTLLMLVSALVGHDNVMRAYREAVANQYRFFSYGDAMWVEP